MDSKNNICYGNLFLLIDIIGKRKFLIEFPEYEESFKT